MTMQVQGRLPLFRVWVLYGWLGAIALVFVGQVILDPTGEGTDWILLYGAKINEAIVAGQVWRLVTPIFIHGSLIHFGVNAYSLFVVGRVVERFYGAGRFSLLFLLSGIAGVVASFVFNPAWSVGASGAIFGLIGAEGVLFYRNRKLLGAQAQAALSNVVLVALMNLGFGALNPGIDNWGHIGGLVCGAALAWLMGPVWEWPTQAVVNPDNSVILADTQGGWLRTLLASAGVALALLVVIILSGWWQLTAR